MEPKRIYYERETDGTAYFYHEKELYACPIYADGSVKFDDGETLCITEFDVLLSDDELDEIKKGLERQKTLVMDTDIVWLSDDELNDVKRMVGKDWPDADEKI